MQNKNIILLVLLWSLVLVAIVLAVRNTMGPSPVVDKNSTGSSGAVLIDVPWKHLPSVSQFKLTDQTGNEFDSAKLAGKPYAVSFFFASCPSICRDLNDQVKRLNDQLKNEDLSFVSVTVDPKEDTPEVLGRYAKDYNATPDRWAFLTGEMYLIKELGEHTFRVIIDKATHTDNILLVDKWGRYRDRFKWDDPYDMKRFVTVARDLAAETTPPMDKIIRTRNAMAGVNPTDPTSIPWLKEFHLIERSGRPFFSRELTGEVWIGNFFFSTCPGICKVQNKYLSGLQKRLSEHPARIVSITTDAETDTPQVLKSYAIELGADENRWLFLTGDQALINRIGSEFFGAQASANHHSSKLFVVDKWGNVRGDFDWQNAAEEVEMLSLIDTLNEENVPPASFRRIRSGENED